jgi:hypothetical protein
MPRAQHIVRLECHTCHQIVYEHCQEIPYGQALSSPPTAFLPAFNDVIQHNLPPEHAGHEIEMHTVTEVLPTLQP